MFLACVVPLPGAQSAERPSSEDGTIVIHYIGRPIGQERYQLNRTDDGIALTAKLDFIDRGGRVELSSAVRLASDLSPISLDATGRTYRFVNIDSHVEIRDGTVHIRDLGAESNRKVPKHFFTGRGYAPLVARALLIQYWEQHGRPRQLTLLPDGNLSALEDFCARKSEPYRGPELDATPTVRDLMMAVRNEAAEAERETRIGELIPGLGRQGCSHFTPAQWPDRFVATAPRNDRRRNE